MTSNWWPGQVNAGAPTYDLQLVARSSKRRSTDCGVGTQLKYHSQWSLVQPVVLSPFLIWSWALVGFEVEKVAFFTGTSNWWDLNLEP